MCVHDQIKAYENSDLEFYDARDVACSKLLDSVMVYKLFNTIDTTDPDEEIVVAVSKLDCIGVQYNNILIQMTTNDGFIQQSDVLGIRGVEWTQVGGEKWKEDSLLNLKNEKKAGISRTLQIAKLPVWP